MALIEARGHYKIRSCEGALCADGTCCPCPPGKVLSCRELLWHIDTYICLGQSCVCCPDGVNCALTANKCQRSNIFEKVTQLSRSQPSVGACLGTVCDDGTCCPSPTGKPDDIVCCPDTLNCAPQASDCPPMLSWNLMTRKRPGRVGTWVRRGRRVTTTIDCGDGTYCDCPPGYPDCVCCPNPAWCARTLSDCTDTNLWSKMINIRKMI